MVSRLMRGLVVVMLGVSAPVFQLACGGVVPGTVTSNATNVAAVSRQVRTQPAARPCGTLTVATYNVNYALAGDAPTMSTLRSLDADVVFLQETNPSWERELGALTDTFSHMQFHHHGEAGGLAVLSNTPVKSAEVLAAPPGGWFPAWRVIVPTEFGSVQVLSVHLRPNISGGNAVLGLLRTPRIREHEIASHLAALDEGMPTVIVGDFNETTRGRALGKLRSEGMLSAFECEGIHDPTWSWQTPVGTLREQVDHIVVDASLDVVSVAVRHEGNSDHFPVTAVLKGCSSVPSR